MITGSPHLYLQDGRAARVPEDVLQAAIQRAGPAEARGLTAVLSLGHLAHQTGAHHSVLRQIVSRESDPYRAFEIRRRRGKTKRYISSPDPLLMSVQRWMLHNIIGRVAAHHISFAYEGGKSIRLCAQRHVGSRWLVKMDLHNFFHAIDERQVFAVLSSIGYAHLPSFEMARLCTRSPRIGAMAGLATGGETSKRNYLISDYPPRPPGFLPQGAPTSGALANLVSRDLDDQLSAIAADTDTVVTRYADDITFSSVNTFSRTGASDLIGRASKAIAQNGFDVHEAKTRIVPPGARRIVLGLLVDSDRPRLTKDFRGRLLRHVRAIERFGLVSHQQSVGFASARGLIRHVRGLMDFASDIEADWTRPYRARWEAALAGEGWVESDMLD